MVIMPSAFTTLNIQNAEYILGYTAARDSELILCYKIIYSKRKPEEERARRQHLISIPEPGTLYKTKRDKEDDFETADDPGQQVLLFSFHDTIVICFWDQLELRCTEFTETGLMKSQNTFSPTMKMMYAAPRTSDPNGTGIWYTGGITPNIRHFTISTCTLKQILGTKCL